MIYGYSERGIFNSIIYYLDSKQQQGQPELIGEFLEELGVKGFSSGEYYFTFLNEQSFSDFGDSDLTIIVKENENDTKPLAVVFIEGKVKTYDKNYVWKTNSNSNNLFAGSNIFVQLYYKYLLQKVVNSVDTAVEKDMTTEKANITLDDKFRIESRKGGRSIGKNGIVIQACNRIKDAGEKYYYVAILPVVVTNEELIKKYDEFNENLEEPMKTENVSCVY